MRVISQNGSVDIPYENFVFGITKDNYIIATRDTIASPSEIVHGVVAQYSSEEKAMKVMTYMQCDFAVGKLYFQFPKDDEV